MNKMLSEVI